jgi:NAD(P)H-nitrite reductase large subunit
MATRIVVMNQGRIEQVGTPMDETLEADLVVVGIGVRPSLGLAELAGIAVDRGIIIDRHLRTSSGDLRGGRCCALARSAQRPEDPRRAFGCRRTPGPDRGA